MIKQLFFLVTFFLGLNCNAQVVFEKGYFIDMSNKKTDCLIKNVGWKNNPTEFTYQLAENTEPKTLGVNAVREFCIYNISKYISKKTNIEMSSRDLNKLSDTIAPIFNEQTVFLKVLLEGKANLYSFEDSKSVRFFYRTDNSQVKPLIFKLYQFSENVVKKNEEFKKQLWNDLKCSNIQVSEIQRLIYRKSDLINFFINYNNCNNYDYNLFENKQKNFQLHLALKAGVNNSSLSFNNNDVDLNFDSKLGFRFGFETEFVLPFNKNKWSIILEPTYQGFKNEGVANLNGEKAMKVDYKSIELASGIRYYMFLNNHSALFVNALFINDLELGKSVIAIQSRSDLEIEKGYNMAFGIGYKLYKNFNVELRIQSRDIINSYAYWDSKYKSTSLIFGYSLF